MSTRKQRTAPGLGPVVSVRLEREVVDRLDALAAGTGRSRGTYLRMAVHSMLPILERLHWEHTVEKFEEIATKDAFE